MIKISKLNLSTLSITTSILLTLTACQSTTSLKNTTEVQLLNYEDQPSTSEMAKRDLIVAIDQSLSEEHMSISESYYRVKPFATGLDKDSNGIFKTIIKATIHKSRMEKEEKDYITSEFVEEIKQEIQDGDLDDMTEEEILEEAEYRYEEYQDEEAEDTKGQNGFEKFKELSKSYVDMKQNKDANSDEDSMPNFIRNAERFLNFLYKTPEQIEAMQEYQMQYSKVNILRHYMPEQKSIKQVFSWDINTPTQHLSVQVPFAIDFKNAKLSVDSSMLMPVMAIFSPENTPLPDEIRKNYTVTFALPKNVQEQIPVEVIYDAFMKSIKTSISEMDSEYFTPVDISTDKFAKDVHANKVVKVYWGSKQQGQLLGKLIKSMANEIKVQVNKNPEKYQNKVVLIRALDGWANIERDFQSNDIGHLAQIIEGILPFELNQTMYYYLANGQLLAYQAKASAGSDLYGFTMDVVTQRYYNQNRVEKSPLYPLLTELSLNHAKNINGNELIVQIGKYKQLKSQAMLARYNYSISDSEDENELYEVIEESEEDMREISFEGEILKDIEDKDKSREYFLEFESK